MVRVAKFLALVLLLNLIRYVVGYPFERFLIFQPLFGEMEKNASYFKVEFTTFDWVTSYFYNFIMWLTATWVFLLLEPRLKGSAVVKSLKVFGLMFLMFASVSAIYMNHYSHPKGFYLWNVLDGTLVYTIVGVANGLLYPVFFRKETGAR